MNFSEKIKQIAFSLGFDACGICKSEPVTETISDFYEEWINSEYNADMDYLSRNQDKRFNPTLLVENTKSIVCVALNYFPAIKQKQDVPQFAYYAYGKDYHDVMKNRLQQLLAQIKELEPKANGRVFCDTAPVLERYWAAKSGLGFIGKNTMLIIPKKGSFFFLGVVMLDIELDYDEPISLSCGTCNRCIDSCPTKALEKPYTLNSNKCISYQTIENRGEIDLEVREKLGNCIYGCDICQQVCPWNRFSEPHNVEEFHPNDDFLNLNDDTLMNLSVEEYQKIFKGSAIKRAKYDGLLRNVKALNVKSKF